MNDDELIELLRANGLNECDAACDRITELLDEASTMSDKLDAAEIRIKLLEAERDSLSRKAALADEWRDHDKDRADGFEAALRLIAETPTRKWQRKFARAALARVKGGE